MQLQTPKTFVSVWHAVNKSKTPWSEKKKKNYEKIVANCIGAYFFSYSQLNLWSVLKTIQKIDNKTKIFWKYGYINISPAVFIKERMPFHNWGSSVKNIVLQWCLPMLQKTLWRFFMAIIKQWNKDLSQCSGSNSEQVMFIVEWLYLDYFALHNLHIKNQRKYSVLQVTYDLHSVHPLLRLGESWNFGILGFWGRSKYFWFQRGGVSYDGGGGGGFIFTFSIFPF